MKIHQLFRENVSEDVILKIIRAFGLHDMNDTSFFCKNDLIKHDTANKIIALKDELEMFYLPCKARYYLNDIDHKKCITILRQTLRLYGLKLHTQQKYIQSKKLTFYNLTRENKNRENPGNIRVTNDVKTIVTFN